MTIAIDLVGTSFGSGTKTYNLNLLKQLIKKSHKDKIYIFSCKNYIKYIDQDNLPENIFLKKKANFLSINLIKIIWMQIIFPFELKFLNVKKIFSPMNYCPILCNILNIKIILGLHSNLPWVRFNQMPGFFLKNYLIKYLMFLSIKSSDKLIVNSFFAKRELKKKLKIKSKKIFVNYLGISDNCKIYNEKKQEIKFNFKSKFILSVSSCVRYHDFFKIIQAFKNINKKKKYLKLVLVMQILDQKYFNEIKNYVNDHSLNDKIYFFNNLNSSSLNKFYNKSMFYIFSSYCEVFGMTTLEAMRHKAPVLVANCSALPEINGNAAIYFDPNDSTDIEKKMSRLIKSKKLRNLLKVKGTKQVKKFTWLSNYNNLFKILKNSNKNS